MSGAVLEPRVGSLSEMSLPVIQMPLSDENIKLVISEVSEYRKIEDFCDSWRKADNELKGNLVYNKKFTEALRKTAYRCLELCDAAHFTELEKTLGEWVDVNGFLADPAAFVACKNGLTTEIIRGKFVFVDALTGFMKDKKMGDGTIKTTLDAFDPELLMKTYKKATIELLSNGDVSSFNDLVKRMDPEGISENDMKDFFHSKEVRRALEKGLVKQIECCNPAAVGDLIEKMSSFGATENEIRDFFRKGKVLASFEKGCRGVYTSKPAPDDLRENIDNPQFVPDKVLSLSYIIIRNGADMDTVIGLRKKACEVGRKAYLKLSSRETSA